MESIAHPQIEDIIGEDANITVDESAPTLP